MPNHDYEFGMLYSSLVMAEMIEMFGAVDCEPLYLIPECMKRRDLSEPDFKKSIPPTTWRASKL